MNRVQDNPLYGRWNAMKQRCLNPSNPKYERYGGRGISIHEDWLDFRTYEEWCLSNGYQKELTLDRIDTNGNYEPNNCRWVNQQVQQNNRNNNRIIMYKDKEYTLAELERETGINSATINQRLSVGMSIDEAVDKKLNFDRIIVELDGKVNHLKAWCEELNLPYTTIHARVNRGWDAKEALTKPVRKGKYYRGVRA